jgi:serine/threonine protein kinase
VVLRSYDTRLRPTSRSPHVYLNAKVKATYSEDLKQERTQLSVQTIGRPLLYLGKSAAASENSDVCNFGDTRNIQKVAEETRQGWLWENYGKLQLIETAFIESCQPNVHEAKRPADFIPIINHLLHLHKQGFVHGDIRAFNIVFDGMNGKLIDFDLSGKVGETRYPPGYKTELPDSYRCGVMHELVKKRDDWYALGKVIFIFHKFQKPEKLDVQDRKLDVEDRIQLSFERSEISIITDRFENLQNEMGISEAFISLLVADLKKLLKHLNSDGWTCQASMGLFLYYYKKNIKGIDPATGSPKL